MRQNSRHEIFAICKYRMQGIFVILPNFLSLLKRFDKSKRNVRHKIPIAAFLQSSYSTKNESDLHMCKTYVVQIKYILGMLSCHKNLQN